MKLFLLTLFIGLNTAAKLSNTYLPPSSAGTAGGHGGFLQGPTSQTVFNNNGQPTQWSHGGWNSGHQQQQQQWSNQQSSWTGNSNHLGSGGPVGPQKPIIPIVSYENVNDGSGNYHFSYETGNGIRAQEQGHQNNPNTDWAENVVAGSFSYTGDDGKPYSIQYQADGNGFRAVGDHLPTPPPQPREIQEVWDRVLAEQAQHQQQGGWQQGAGTGGAWQQGGSSTGGWQQGGSSAGGWQQGGGGGHHQQTSSSWQQSGGHSGAPRPQKPINQYLPPGNTGGYHY